MNPFHTPCVTRARLMALSGFRLPAAAKGRRRQVAPLTYEQVRYFERKGCFDGYKLKPAPGKRLPVLIWKPRRLGATALYTLLDVAVARLCAWMLQEGTPHATVVHLLRQQWGRVTMAADGAFVLVVEPEQTAWMLSTADLEAELTRWHAEFGKALTPGNTRRYPMAWLGITDRFVSGFQKELERPTVPLWNRRITPAAALALQQEHPAR